MKKALKFIEVTQKVCSFFWKPKNFEIQTFEPPKMGQAYVYMKISEYPISVETFVRH